MLLRDFDQPNIFSAARDTKAKWSASANTTSSGRFGTPSIVRPLKDSLSGRNYGWPVITYGVDYSGEHIGEGTAKERGNGAAGQLSN